MVSLSAQTLLDWGRPFSVDGIKLGSSRQEVLNQLGAPQSKSHQNDQEIWKYRDQEVSFRSGQACRVYGSVLQQNSKPLARAGELSGVVRRRLGEPLDNQALGIPPNPGVDLMMYQNEAFSIGVFSREGRVSVVGLTRRN